MKRIYRVMCLALVMVMVLGMARYHVAKAETTEGEEEKVYSNATIDEEFADDRILIVLKNEASLAVDQHEGLAEYVDCKNIRNLSQAKEAEVQEKLNNISLELEQVAELTRTTEIVTAENMMAIAAQDEELSEYNQILCLELEEAGKDKVLEAIEALEGLGDILYVGPDYVMTVGSTTADDTHANQQWAINMIKLPQAWDITTGSASVTVAVLDTGIDGDHPDLVNQIDTSLCRKFTSGYEVAVEEPTDDYYNSLDGVYGHGSYVAGIIGAAGNNGTGITGTCWNVKLASLQVFESNGRGYSSYTISAIDFAEEQNIPIINFSGGWFGDNITNFYNSPLDAAIGNYSGLFVCIAGNEGVSIDTNTYYPANCAASNIIVVGACTSYDDPADESSYGKNNVDIYAPGISVYSTNSTGGYGYCSGTSFAAPYVSGVAALLLSKDSTLTVEELKATILNNVDVLYDSEGENIYYDCCSSGGRLNAYKALTNLVHIHTYKYTNNGVYSGHTCTCTECGYARTESHDWFAVLSLYQCSKCGVKSSIIPSTPAS